MTTLYKNATRATSTTSPPAPAPAARTTRPGRATTTSPASARRWPTWSSSRSTAPSRADLDRSPGRHRADDRRRRARRSASRSPPRTSSGATDAGYTGTVHFTSSDAQAGLPADYTFTAADAGSHTFTVTLKTAGTQSITATDTATLGRHRHRRRGSRSARPPRASSSSPASPRPRRRARRRPFTVTAKDAYGNVATGYTGTVHFTSSDAAADPAGQLHLHGRRQGGAHLHRDVRDGRLAVGHRRGHRRRASTATQSGITVAPAAPINLTASAASTTQINLTWTGSAGATGYLSSGAPTAAPAGPRSARTAAGTTSYQDTGLAAGTTYYYRVQATGGSVDSAYSNIASATTTGTAAGGDRHALEQLVHPVRRTPTARALTSWA